MRQDKIRISKVLWLLAVLGLSVFILGGCFLLGPQVVIPTLAPNASPVVGVITDDATEPTSKVERVVTSGKTVVPKTAATKETKAKASSTPTKTKKPSTSTSTATLKPPTPSLTPEPPCPQPVDDRLIAAYSAAGGRTRLGCAKAGATEEQWGLQEYEHGWMFWRGPKTAIYAGKADDSYAVYPDEWNSTLPERSCDFPAPSGLMQPKRGFGMVWCKNGDLRVAIGFAVAEEFPAQAVVQEFDNGIIAAQTDGSARIFYTDGTWQDLGFPS